MKRKTLFLLSILTISATILSGCKSADSVENSETIETTAIESEATETEIAEATETETSETKEQDTDSTTTKFGSTTTTTGNNTTASSNDKIVESESWPEYKETMDYYVDQGLLNQSEAYLLNPDIYGTDTAGKTDGDFPIPLGKSVSEYIKRLKLSTTKGFSIQAYWYKETNTVQYVYTGEVNPYGGWFTDLDSMDALDDAFNHEKTLLDMTHQQKIDILGEPSLSPEEVIELISNGVKDAR